MIRQGIRRVLWLALRRRDRWEREVEEEIKIHLALRAEQLIDEGRSPDAAYAEAVRRFGPLHDARARLLQAARHREERMQRTEYLDDLRQDTSFALRGLARQKMWTVVTVITLALGIGATTAVFSVVSTLLLHPLPYPHADRIVYVNQQPSGGNNTGIQVTITPSAPVMRAWMQSSRSFETLLGSTLGPKRLKTQSGEPSTIMAEAVFPSFTDFTGMRPMLGRMFTNADIESGGRVAVVSESFWRDRLDGSRDVLGKVLTLNDSTYAIVGVMHDIRLANGSQPTAVWLPLDVRNDALGMSVIGRLRPGATPATAAKELDSIFARSAGFTGGKIPFRAVVTTPAQRVAFRDSLIMLAAAVGLVLLVACANVAHLLLARSATRQRELAIRAALGAGRGRLLRQLLTESLLLSGIGTLAGLFVGWAGLHALIAKRPNSLRTLQQAHLDGTTLAIGIGIALVSGAFFAIISAVQASRHATHDALKAGSLATAGGTRRHGRGRALLVVSEMGLAAMLLVGAVLLVRSVSSLQNTNLGFEPRGLYTFNVPLKAPSLASDAAKREALAGFLARLHQLPTVRSASAASVAPGSRWFSIGRLEIGGEAPPPHESSSFIDINKVQPGYFATMGIHIVEGRVFSDTTDAGHQVMVNESFARKHWARGTAVGRRLRIAQTDSEPWLTIAGVVNDAQTNGPIAESTAPMLYVPLDKIGDQVVVLARVAGDAGSLAPATAYLKELGIKRPAPPESVLQRVSASIATPRYVTMLLTIFTALALMLTSVGLYGVMSYTVAQQTREIGIRVALGANGGRIARAVVGRAAALAVCGAVVGLIAAVWGTKLIETQLHGVTRLDPLSFTVGGVVLIGAALAACIVPTRRALSVDPVTAIRAD
ncbi:MAG TPA: ABC transporter permease [Gemmatimonadaceae bacterium]|nr:ABC transporter permease [Gemmatimonadaceae bacterium]